MAVRSPLLVRSRQRVRRLIVELNPPPFVRDPLTQPGRERRIGRHFTGLEMRFLLAVMLAFFVGSTLAFPAEGKTVSGAPAKVTRLTQTV